MHRIRQYRTPLVALLISGVFLALSLRTVDAARVRESLAAGHYGWAVLAAGVSAAVVLLRSARWWLIYAAQHRVPFSHVNSASTISLMVNAVLPFRGVSTLIRSFLIRRHTGVPIVTSIGTITVERFWEVASQAITISIVLLAVDLPGWTGTGAWVLLGINALMLTSLASLWRFPGPTEAVLQRLLGLFSKRVGMASVAHFQAFREGLAAVGKPAILAGVAALSALIAVGQGVAVWLALRAFHLDVPVATAWAIYIGVTFGLVLPSAPAGLGTFQFVVISILGGFGVGESVALSTSFVVQAALLGPPIVLGLAFLFVEGLSLDALAGRVRVKATFEQPAEKLPAAVRE